MADVAGVDNRLAGSALKDFIKSAECNPLKPNGRDNLMLFHIAPVELLHPVVYYILAHCNPSKNLFFNI